MPRRRNELMMFYNIAAVPFDVLLADTASITGMISYQRIHNKTEENTAEDSNADVMLFNKLAVEDRKGNR